MNSEMKNPIPALAIDANNKTDRKLEILSFEELYEECENLITQPHRTDCYQLILIVDGNGKIRIDSFEYMLRPRSLFTIAKGQIEVLCCEQGTSGYIVIFSDDYFHRHSDDIKWISSLKQFNPQVDSFNGNLSRTEYLEILNIILEIDLELKGEDNFAREEIVFNLLKMLIIKSERVSRTQDSDENDTGGAYYISEFKKKLEENFFHSRMVSFYADSLSITPKKLNQVAYISCGKPAKQMIEERVMLEIKRLLIYSDQTIKEIGFSLGFTDPTNFNKYFKKYTDITPADFREINKKTVLHY
jgi:AraC-like DNA-binding protein